MKNTKFSFAGKAKDIASRLGIDKTFFIDFQSVKELGAQEFFDRVICETLSAKKLYCGFNYRFGKNAGGDTALLALLCEEYGIELNPIDTLRDADCVIAAVSHREFIDLGIEGLLKLYGEKQIKILIDVKGMFQIAELKKTDINWWRL